MDLTARKQSLVDERDRIAARLGRITSAKRHESGPASADWEEQAVERENDEVLDQLDDTTRLKLAHLNGAIARIDRGTYGRCVECDETIPEQRLNALPETPTCTQCAEAA